jgi:hypothetical protein
MRLTPLVSQRICAEEVLAQAEDWRSQGCGEAVNSILGKTKENIRHLSVWFWEDQPSAGNPRSTARRNITMLYLHR